jgi:transposase
VEKKCYLGIDISKDTLDIVIFNKGNNYDKENYLRIENNNSGFKGMLQWFKNR